MAGALQDAFAGLDDGEELEVRNEQLVFRVRYVSEQATGDNGAPARGYVVGWFEVSELLSDGPRHLMSYRHSPHGPTLMMAKPYAAGQAARFISDRVTRTRIDSL